MGKELRWEHSGLRSNAFEGDRLKAWGYAVYDEDKNCWRAEWNGRREYEPPYYPSQEAAIRCLNEAYSAHNAAQDKQSLIVVETKCINEAYAEMQSKRETVERVEQVKPDKAKPYYRIQSKEEGRLPLLWVDKGSESFAYNTEEEINYGCPCSAYVKQSKEQKWIASYAVVAGVSFRTIAKEHESRELAQIAAEKAAKRQSEIAESYKAEVVKEEETKLQILYVDLDAPDAADIIEICNELRQMLLEKNAKYGGSATEPVRIFSRASEEEQILVRLDDKLSRISKGCGIEDEDVIMDIMGYLVLLKIVRRRNAKKAEQGS